MLLVRASIVFLGLALVAACGATESTSAVDAVDAGADARVSSEAGVADAEAGSPVFTPASCDAGLSGSSDGGACDRTRMRVVHRGVVGCFDVGQFCDTVMVGLPTADVSKLPQGFTCGSELGVATCTWPLTNHSIDQAAIDAACAVTQALPTANVDCIIYD